MLSYRLVRLVLTLAAIFSGGAAWAGKQTICHYPPGNPSNFHTITISDNAVDKHLEKHGDRLGTCQADCENYCNDGDACTQDAQPNRDECTCMVQPRPAVNCDDSNACTFDSCDPTTGCQYDAAAMEGHGCDDGDPDTYYDTCANGVCVGISGPPPA
jgi:hypothetical protein